MPVWSCKPCFYVIFFATRNISFNSNRNFLFETKQKENPISETPWLRTRFSDPQTLTRQNSRSTNLCSWRRREKIRTVARTRQFVKSRSPWGWEIENPWLQFVRANALQHSCGLLCRHQVSALQSLYYSTSCLIGCLGASRKSALLNRVVSHFVILLYSIINFVVNF